MGYIERAEIERFIKEHGMIRSYDSDLLPDADVAPVRHGRWIDKPTGRYGQWQAWCSECNERCGCGGTIESQHKRFCPNCGAIMDLED